MPVFCQFLLLDTPDILIATDRVHCTLDITGYAMEQIASYLRAMLALHIAQLSETQPGLKVDVILGRAGIGIQEIADLTGKSYLAVAKSLSRGGIAAKRRRSAKAEA